MCLSENSDERKSASGMRGVFSAVRALEDQCIVPPLVGAIHTRIAGGWHQARRPGLCNPGDALPPVAVSDMGEGLRPCGAYHPVLALLLEGSRVGVSPPLRPACERRGVFPPHEVG